MLAILTKWNSVYTIMQEDDAEKRGVEVGRNLAGLAILSKREGLLQHLVDYFVKLSRDADANFCNCTLEEEYEYKEYGSISWAFTQYTLAQFARSVVGAFEVGGDGDFGGDEDLEMDVDGGLEGGEDLEMGVDGDFEGGGEGFETNDHSDDDYDTDGEGGGAPQEVDVVNYSHSPPPKGFRIVKGELVARPCVPCRKGKKGCPHKAEKLQKYKEKEARLRQKQQRSATK
jgi:hypothetical protein